MFSSIRKKIPHKQADLGENYFWYWFPLLASHTPAPSRFKQMTSGSNIPTSFHSQLSQIPRSNQYCVTSMWPWLPKLLDVHQLTKDFTHTNHHLSSYISPDSSCWHLYGPQILYLSTFLSHLWKLDKFTNSNVLCFDSILIFLVKHSRYINRTCNSQISWLNLTLKSIFSYQGFNPSCHTAFDINLPLPWNVLKRKRNRLQTWEDY